MNFTENTYRYIRNTGNWAIAFGIIIILSDLFLLMDYGLQNGRGFGSTWFLVKRLVFSGLSAIFLFLLANRCLAIRRGQDNAQYWEQTLIMMRNYIFLLIATTGIWVLSSFIPFL